MDFPGLTSGASSEQSHPLGMIEYPRDGIATKTTFSYGPISFDAPHHCLDRRTWQCKRDPVDGQSEDRSVDVRGETRTYLKIA